MKRSLIVMILKYGVGFAILAWVIWQYWDVRTDSGQQVGLSGVLERPFHIGPYVLAAAICLPCILLTYLRWFILVRAQGLPFTLVNAVRLGMIGSCFNTFFPGSVGGDILKAAFLAREQSRRTVAVATVLVDRIVGLCGLVWLATLIGGTFWATGLLPQMAASAQALVVLEGILITTTALMAGSILFWLAAGLMPVQTANTWAERLARIPKVGGAVAELWRAAWMYRARGKSVAQALGLAMVGHVGFVLCYYLGSRSVNPFDDVPTLLAHYVVIPVGMTIQASVPLPGGIGGGEFAFGKLYELIGFNNAAGVLVSLVRRSIDWLLGIGFFVMYLRMKPALRTQTSPNGEGLKLAVGSRPNDLTDPG